MIEEQLFALERDAERRVREAGDRETERGGPGADRRASEAMDAPMLEVAAIRNMRQRFGDVRMEIDHHRGVLRRTKQDPDLPSEVKRHRQRHAEMRLAALAEEHRTLEAESVLRFPELKRRPGSPARDPVGAGGLRRTAAPAHRDGRAPSPARAGPAPRFRGG